MSLFRILSIQNSKRRIIIKSHAYCVQLTVYCQRKKNLFISLIKLDFNNLMHIALASWCLCFNFTFHEWHESPIEAAEILVQDALSISQFVYFIMFMYKKQI